MAVVRVADMFLGGPALMSDNDVDEPIDRAKLFLDADMTGVQTLAVASGKAAVYSARCPGKETANEDSAALIPFNGQSGALVVADGMGGGRVGDQASATAVRALRRSLAKAEREGGALRDAILTGIELANREVLALSGAATTILVAEIADGSLRVYHVGDSMVLVVGQRGKLRHQTIAHSPVAAAVEAGVVDEADAIHHEDRHLVSNMVGSEDMRIEIGPTIKLRARDTVIAASDGLFDNLHIAEIVEHIRKGPLERAMQRLADDASARMTDPLPDQPCKPDDLTFVSYRPNPPKRKPREATPKPANGQ